MSRKKSVRYRRDERAKARATGTSQLLAQNNPLQMLTALGQLDNRKELTGLARERNEISRADLAQRGRESQQRISSSQLAGQRQDQRLNLDQQRYGQLDQRAQQAQQIQLMQILATLAQSQRRMEQQQPYLQSQIMRNLASARLANQNADIFSGMGGQPATGSDNQLDPRVIQQLMQMQQQSQPTQ